MEYNHYLAMESSNGGQVDTIFTDFSKALDKIDHNILLRKFSSLGFGSCMVKWLETCLRDRRQIV